MVQESNFVWSSVKFVDSRWRRVDHVAWVSLASWIVKNSDGYQGKAEDWLCMKLLQEVWRLAGWFYSVSCMKR